MQTVFRGLFILDFSTFPLILGNPLRREIFDLIDFQIDKGIGTQRIDF